MGMSDSQRRRTLLDWPADVRELTDARGADLFAVVGFSSEAAPASEDLHLVRSAHV